KFASAPPLPRKSMVTPSSGTGTEMKVVSSMPRFQFLLIVRASKSVQSGRGTITSPIGPCRISGCLPGAGVEASGCVEDGGAPPGGAWAKEVKHLKLEQGSAESLLVRCQGRLHCFSYLSLYLRRFVAAHASIHVQEAFGLSPSPVHTRQERTQCAVQT